ncbi:HNH endonuclease [Lysinibacillus sp. TE18511]
MTLDMGSLSIGEEYVRDTLVKLWGYKSRQAISRGIVTPAKEKKIILFVTKIKQKSDTQYKDYFIEEGFLHMEGETSHTNDKRLIDAQSNGESIYLFYRDIHHTPFKYYGEVYLVDFQIHSSKPSIFIFSTSFTMSVGLSGLYVEANKTNSVKENFIPDREGMIKVKTHIKYERSLKNRAKAIEIHGTICKACGFNFNEYYGVELARHFIEIHHVVPLSELEEGKPIDPNTDLIPLCSNCHSMIHKKRDLTLSVDDLREIIKEQRKK